jgi:hypothetical protein
VAGVADELREAVPKLIIVRQIGEGNAGTTNVESTPRAGTTFGLSFPHSR